mmetsp:Transcript_9136/g.26928  ORF Transcript_9136/g.26928 Transcript_9136/m.26928 type:complete len:301 (+) Transcript_9136:738-1640(+)
MCGDGPWVALERITFAAANALGQSLQVGGHALHVLMSRGKCWHDDGHLGCRGPGGAQQAQEHVVRLVTRPEVNVCEEPVRGRHPLTCLVAQRVHGVVVAVLALDVGHVPALRAHATLHVGGHVRHLVAHNKDGGAHWPWPDLTQLLEHPDSIHAQLRHQRHVKLGVMVLGPSHHSGGSCGSGCGAVLLLHAHGLCPRPEARAGDCDATHLERDLKCALRVRHRGGEAQALAARVLGATLFGRRESGLVHHLQVVTLGDLPSHAHVAVNRLLWARSHEVCALEVLHHRIAQLLRRARRGYA